MPRPSLKLVLTSFLMTITLGFEMTSLSLARSDVYLSRKSIMLKVVALQ